MKTPKPIRDWKKEQDRFLQELGAEWHFHRVFDRLPNIYFFVKNRAGETLFCSSNLPMNHGLPDEATMIGKTDHELTPGPLAQKYLSDDAEIYRTGLPLPAIIELCVDQVGLPNWYQTNKYPLKNRDGEVIGIMGTFHPVEFDDLDKPTLIPLEAARRLIHRSIECFPGIEYLADEARMSKRNFQRRFQSTYGMSAQTYWMKLRVRQACKMIQSGTFKLVEIADRLGFCDQSTFTKHFKAHASMTPKQYAMKIVKR